MTIRMHVCVILNFGAVVGKVACVLLRNLARKCGESEPKRSEDPYELARKHDFGESQRDAHSKDGIHAMHAWTVAQKHATRTWPRKQTMRMADLAGRGLCICSRVRAARRVGERLVRAAPVRVRVCARTRVRVRMCARARTCVSVFSCVEPRAPDRVHLHLDPLPLKLAVFVIRETCICDSRLGIAPVVNAIEVVDLARARALDRRQQTQLLERLGEGACEEATEK
eukprot:743734-Pleurochrysis_carterae.AAC.1